MESKLRKFLIGMSKICIYGIVLQLSFSLAVATDVEAQLKSINEVEIHLDYDDQVKLRKVLNKIEKSTDFQFSFIDQELTSTSDNKLTLNASDFLLGDLLRSISEQSGLSFRRVNNHIFIKQKEQGFPAVTENVAQSTVKGRITSEDGEGLPGASVVVKGTTNGTTTDIDGAFSLNVPEEAILIVSFVGYQAQEIVVGDRTVIDVQLEEDSEQLEEVVVVGYGTQRKSDLTGSVVQVNSKDFVKGANTNALQLLTGKASGVHISQGSNAPGGTVEIKVRGLSSVNGGNNVLVVIDGMPNGDVNALSPDDIESIQVLKDASASAIYGSRAANGVVLITTRQGKKNETHVSYNSYVGFQNVVKQIDMLDGQEWMRTLNELDFESDPGNATDPGYVPRFSDAEIAAAQNFNWQDQVFRQSTVQNHQLSLSGGGDKTTYYASLNYLNNDGVIRNSSLERYNARLNLTVNPVEKLSINFNINANRALTAEVPLGTSYDGVVSAALQFDPTIDAELNNQGTFKLNDFMQVDNPEGVLQGWDRNRAENNLFANARINYEILMGLKINVNLGARLTNSKYEQYQNRFTPQGAGANGTAMVQNRDNTYGIAEYLLSYELVQGLHDFKVQAGMTYEKFENKLLQAEARDFISDANVAFYFQAANPENFLAETNYFTNQLRSQLARVNYTYNNKYLLTASMRIDGSSKFRGANKTAIFPSASVGWQMAEEAFLSSQDLIGSLKLRVGYGEIGNQAISNFETRTTYVPGTIDDYSNAVLGEVVQTGLVPTRIANEDLKWETTKEINVGVDFALANFRISGSAEYYVRNTTDQLFNRPVPRSAGFGSYRVNFGNVRNKGVDISLNTKNLIGALKWETDLTLSFLNNEVTEVPEFVGGRVLSAGGFPFAGEFAIVQEGSPLNAFYGYQIDGIYSTQTEVDAAAAAFPDGSAREGLGHPIVADVNQDGTISPEDRVILGDPFADLIFGFNNRFSYRNFTLDVYFTGVQGIETFNFLVAESFYPIDPDRNKLANYYNDRWTPENPNSGYPSMVEPGRYQDGRKVNKWTVQDASFIRLRNVTLGYDLPLESRGFSDANVFISLENMLTIAPNFDGFDPDANSSGNQGNTARTTKGTFGDYPLARTIRLGFKIGL